MCNHKAGTKGVPISWRDEFRWRNVGFYYSQPYKFAKAQWRIPPVAYLLWRLAWAGWNLSWLVYSIWSTADPHSPLYQGAGAKWLIYLTNLAYLILTLQSVLHAVVVLCHCAAKKVTPLAFTRGDIRWYVKLLWLLTSVTFNTAILVTVLYWTIVFTGVWTVISLVVHGVNSVYVLSDIFVAASPVRLLHAVYTILFGAAYIVFTVIYHFLHGTGALSRPYIYSVLNWSVPGIAVGASLVPLLVGIPVLHLLQFGLYVLRVQILPTCPCCHSCTDDDSSAGEEDRDDDDGGGGDSCRYFGQISSEGIEMTGSGTKAAANMENIHRFQFSKRC